jgi:hypothetical protein
VSLSMTQWPPCWKKRCAVLSTSVRLWRMLTTTSSDGRPA